MSGAKPDIIHVHEWQTSAVPMLYWEAYASQGLPDARLVLTIHCLDNSGECREDEFAFTGAGAALVRCWWGCGVRGAAWSCRPKLGWLFCQPLNVAWNEVADVGKEGRIWPDTRSHPDLAAIGSHTSSRCLDESCQKDTCAAIAAGLVAACATSCCACCLSATCMRRTVALPILRRTGLQAAMRAITWLPATLHQAVEQAKMLTAGMPGKAFAKSDKALDDRTIGHNPERLSLLKVRSQAL